MVRWLAICHDQDCSALHHEDDVGEFAGEKGEVLSGFGELSRYSSFLKFPDLNTPSAVSINFFT